MGIHSSSYGSGVGLPVIRGQAGPRVQVLQNGLNSLDASTLSPDHANSTESFWAERVEVIRGAATLLYGSGAVGGVVNVIDDRIPEKTPEQLLSGAAEQRYNTANDGKTTAFKLDGGKGILAWHLDGFFRDHRTLQIPGHAIEDSFIQTANASAVGEGRLPNSHARAKNGSAGFSLNNEFGFIGFAVNHLENDYGIPPGGYDGDDDIIRVDMRQTRYDMKGELDMPWFGIR